MFRFFERRYVFPAPRANEDDWNVSDLPYEDIYFTAADGTQLHGWYVPHPHPRASVLYCHGNGEYVARLSNRLKVLHHRIGVSVFAWDYRSYGLSKGIPHEQNVISDARVAQLWLADREKLSPTDLVLMGRSLGGAVAVALAADFGARGLVLDRTFGQLTDAAAHRFPWLPVHLLMSNRFCSLENILRYNGPLLQSHGTEDRVVPLSMGRLLFDASPSEHKRFLEVAGGDHNGPLPDYCYDALIEFVDSLK